MSVAAAGGATGSKGLSRLWNRQLETYPDAGPRIIYLGITVLATVMLYYELYVTGSVSTLLLAKFNMSFPFYVYTLAFGNLLGAFGSLFAGIADRLGRTNMIVIGLFFTAIFTGFFIPASTNKWEFAIFSFVVFVVEGICLVATPALIRDFSPQVGRATAMGFWTAGPVLGSLAAALVASYTIPSYVSPAHDPGFWTHEYRIAGIVGLVVFVIALFGLKELAPGLRDQLMVTIRDRALIQARAKGIDVEASLRNPWGQLIKPEIVLSALGIALFLLAYYTAVAFGLVYFTTVFGFGVSTGNRLGNWTWGVNVAAVLLFGLISDYFRVRKPFMILGGAGAAIVLVFYLEQAGKPTSFTHMAVLVSLLSFALGVAYVPWMASYTETVEDRNPALTATGLAIWGWIVRTVIFVSYMILPVVVHSVTPLVQHGSTVQALVAKYPAANLPAPVLSILQKDPTNSAALAEAKSILGPNYLRELLALSTAPASDKAYLEAHGTQVANAKKDSPDEWKNWYWICFGGMVFFLGTVPIMRGRWSPAAARRDETDHAALVEAEMAKLGIPSNA